MPITVPLTTDELLTTTRAVRRRLDLTRPVPRSLVEECLQCAIQAPTAGNGQSGTSWSSRTLRRSRRSPTTTARRGTSISRSRALSRTFPPKVRSVQAEQDRVTASAQYLVDHFHRVPILMIPCHPPSRRRGRTRRRQCSLYGGVMPAAWSFQLAARARGLASCWTSLHLMFEREIAELLGIDYTQTQQVAGICLAWSKGTDFKPAKREPLASKLHWDTW